MFHANSGSHRAPSFPSFPSVQIPQQTLLARADMSPLRATRAISQQQQTKQQKKVSK
jgi:hypothetical protein